MGMRIQMPMRIDAHLMRISAYNAKKIYKTIWRSNYHINSWVDQLSIQVIWCDIACYSDRVCFLYSNIVCDCQLEAPEWFIWDGCMKSKRNKATTYRLQSCLVSLQNGSFFPLYAADAHQDFYMRISAYAHHPHEPHGSASACPSLINSSGKS